MNSVNYYCVGCLKQKNSVNASRRVLADYSITENSIPLCGVCRGDWYYYIEATRMGFLKKYESKIVKESVQRVITEIETQRLLRLADKQNAAKLKEAETAHNEVELNEQYPDMSGYDEDVYGEEI